MEVFIIVFLVAFLAGWAFSLSSRLTPPTDTPSPDAERYTVHNNAPFHIDIRSLRDLHRARLGAWGVPWALPYEDEVVLRIERYVRGLADEPIDHEHSIYEIGMCLECDAAAVLELWRAVKP